MKTMTNQQMQYAYWQRMRQQQIYRAYVSGAATKKNSYDKISKVSDDYFLNYLEYSPKNIDSQKAADYLKSFDPQFAAGRCTGIYDQSVGRTLRQLDWYYNNEVEFIIKMNPDPAKEVYGSIGVTAASPKMTKDIAEHYITTGKYYEYFDFLPFFTVDGINEKGIFAQSNVVNKHGIDININKDVPGKTDCCIPMLVRYILDKFDEIDLHSKNHVRTKLMDNLHIFGTSKLGGYNSHVLVACHAIKRSYVIEFTADDILVNEFPIMTNFRTINDDLDPIDINEDYMVDWDEIESDGIGLERWETCAKFLKQTTRSIDDFKELRDQLDYTHAYDRPFVKNVTWLTDNLSGDLTVSDMKEYHYDPAAASRKVEIESALDGYRAQFDRRQRTDKNVTWITTHSTIYDLVNLSCNIKSQMSTGEQTCWNVDWDGNVSEVHEFNIKSINGKSNIYEANDPSILSVLQYRGNVSPYAIQEPYASNPNISNHLSVTSVVDDGSLTAVGEQSFRECSNLKSVSLPAVSSLASTAFFKCSALSSIYVDNDTLHSTENGYGEENQLVVTDDEKSLVLAVRTITQLSDDELTVIGPRALQYCDNLSSLDCSAVTRIQLNSFQGCKKLMNVSFPEATHIDNYAFNECLRLTSVSIPKMTYINNNAFNYCTKLSTVVLSSVTNVPILGGKNSFGAKRAWPVSVYIPYGMSADFMETNTWPSLVENKTIQLVEMI